jgi:hypothetical protein
LSGAEAAPTAPQAPNRQPPDRRLPGVSGVKVDAHRQRIGAHRRRRGHAQAARQVAPADTPLPLARVVIVQDVRRSGPPADTRPAADLDPDARVGLDVLHPVGAPPALGHQPEGLPVQAIAHWRAPRLSRTPPSRLQQGVAGRRNAKLPREHDDRVDHPLLQRVDDTILGG